MTCGVRGRRGGGSALVQRPPCPPRVGSVAWSVAAAGVAKVGGRRRRGAPGITSAAMTDSVARARALLAAHPVLDGHNDLPWAMRLKARYDLDAVDLALPPPRAHTHPGPPPE